MWFEPSEPLRTTPQHKETLGEGVLQVFGVVRPPPNLFELHLRSSKHLVRVFYTCSVWFDPPNLLELHLSTSKHLVRVFYTCSVWFEPSEPLRTTPQHKETLGEGVLHVFGVVRPLRTSSNYTNGQANTWRGCSTCVQCGSTGVVRPLL